MTVLDPLLRLQDLLPNASFNRTHNTNGALHRRRKMLCILGGVAALFVLLTFAIAHTAFDQDPLTLSADELSDAFLADYPECAPSPLPPRAVELFDVEPLAQVSGTERPAPAADEPIVLTTHRLSNVAPAEPYTLRWRIGVGLPEKDPHLFPWPETRPGWYLNWTTGAIETEGFMGIGRGVKMTLPNERSIGMTFAPMVRVHNGVLIPNAEVIAELAANNRGRMWLIGNEPDVQWQDNSTAEQYAYAYRCAHALIKRNDPSAQVAIGGVSQVTPLRIAYIERIWNFYATEFGERMPVDVWNMHAFVLREEANSWGVRIPPGFEDVAQGMLWEPGDHSDVTLIEEQVVRMRTWMAQNGERDKPLIISEYGILLPQIFGYPQHIVSEFMWNSFDLFATLRDPALGYAADDNRLVQRWVWFSSRYDLYESGNLYDNRGEPTILTRALNVYIEEHSE